jgi:WD40 repeat protein
MVIQWRVTDGEVVRSFGPSDVRLDVEAIAVSPDGTLLAAGLYGCESSVRVWRVRDGALLHNLRGTSACK